MSTHHLQAHFVGLKEKHARCLIYEKGKRIYEKAERRKPGKSSKNTKYPIPQTLFLGFPDLIHILEDPPTIHKTSKKTTLTSAYQPKPSVCSPDLRIHYWVSSSSGVLRGVGFESQRNA